MQNKRQEKGDGHRQQIIDSFLLLRAGSGVCAVVQLQASTRLKPGCQPMRAERGNHHVSIKHYVD